MTAIPSTMKALVVESIGNAAIKSIPTPSVIPGSVLVQVLASVCNPNAEALLKANFQLPFTFPTPFVPGAYGIGRVVTTGPDTTSLTVGQLVLVDPFVRGRDNPDVQILWAAFDGPTPASKKLMADNWRNGMGAEYVLAPLENTWALDEQRLCGGPTAGGLGLTIPELVHIAVAAVAYGGLRSIDLKAGERIIIAPATGLFSGGAVALASAMGANVVAVSRNAEALAHLKRQFPRVETMQPTGDVQADTATLRAMGPIHAYADISPPQATGSSHLASCIAAVKQYGRVCLIGGRGDPGIPINYAMCVFNNLTIRGQYMYEREDVAGVIRLVESGLLSIGEGKGLVVAGTYKLEDYASAFKAANAGKGPGTLFCLVP